MSYESLTYAELIDLRTKYCDKLRKARPNQLNTDWYRDLAREIAWINTQLMHTEVVSPNRF